MLEMDLRYRSTIMEDIKMVLSQEIDDFLNITKRYTKNIEDMIENNKKYYRK